MIFFVANDGTIINSVPSQVYQGSAEANDVYLIAPFATGLQVAVAFKLPNGVYTERYPMTKIGEIEGVINKQSGKPYSGWQFAVPNEITQYFGTVTAQFFIYTANGAITATSSTSFVVGKGVPTDLTSPPPPDVYTKIMENLSNMQQQLDNGWFTARAVAAWNPEYTYSGGDLVFYQDKGDYGVLLKSLTDNNNSAPYSADGVLDAGNWLLVSDFNILTDLYNLQTEMELAVKTATEKAQAAGKSADNAQSSSQSSAASAQAAQEAAQSVQASAEYLEGIQSGTIAVAKAEKDGTGENIAEQFTDINGKIPSTASAENQLADKAFVNSSINNMAAFYITSNAQGDAFATRASLLAAATFYSGGAIRVPTQNDYAIVLADESQPKGVDGSYPTTRYSYQGGVYPDGQWDFQYIVNNTSLTQDQVNAINSGITKEIVDQLTKGNVTGVKGAAETAYRVGNVNLTPENIGAVNKSGDTITGDISIIGKTTIYDPTIGGTYLELGRKTASGIEFHCQSGNSYLDFDAYIQANSATSETEVGTAQLVYAARQHTFSGPIVAKSVNDFISEGNEFNFFTQSNYRIWIGYRGGEILEGYYMGAGTGNGNTAPLTAKELYEAPTAGITKVRMYSPNNPPPLPKSRIALTLMGTNLTVSNNVIIADSVSDIEENTLYVFIKDNIPYLGWCVSPEGEGDYIVYTSAGNGRGWLYRIQIINS